MILKNKKEHKKEKIYKFIGIIFYFIFSLSGLSILFIFPPKKFLFANSYEDEVKKELYKNFVKIVYDNINKPLIKDIQYSKENEPCPTGFEELIIANEYYGNFSKFYGNASFCIQRFDDNRYNYENLLFNSKDECESGKRPCGKINRHLNKSFCIDKDKECPLNELDFQLKPSSESYPTPGNRSFLASSYGKNKEKTAIVNIDIINNERLCLEKFYRNNKLPCEFPDNNQCFIIIGYDLLTSGDLNYDFQLISKNIVRWKFINYNESNYNFCQNSNFQFHIFTSNYYNFTYESLSFFKEEFPLNDENNNPLYLTYKASKDKINIDILFYLLSCILFCWSLPHFILQILVYLDIKKIRKYYILNGIILFFFKLLCLFGMITYHFCFGLKIKKVYIELIDEPLNQILKGYKKTRILFIIQIFIFWIIGFLIIIVDLIILFFTYRIQWGKDDLEIKIVKKKSEIENSQNTDINKIINHIGDKINNTEEKKFEEIKVDYSINNKIYTNEDNKIDNKETKSMDFRENISVKSDEINLQFVCNDNISNIYEINVKKDENFGEVIKKLKEKYPILEEKRMKAFSYESKIIAQTETLEDNGISYNVKIIIYN